MNSARVAVLFSVLALTPHDLPRESHEVSAIQAAACHTVAGVSLDYPAAFTADPPIAPVPIFESYDGFSATTEGVRLKVLRISYVKDYTADAGAALNGVVGFWKTLADSGRVDSHRESRTVSGIQGQIAEAQFSLQGKLVHGEVLALAQDRVLWQFITVFPDSPFGRSLIQRALESIQIPGKCG